MNQSGKAVLLVGLLILLSGCGGTEMISSTPLPEVSRATPVAPVAPAAEEEVYLLWPCFFSQTVDGAHHTLTLENPAENAVSIRIMVQDLDNGATLYQSGVLAPGEQEIWDIFAAYQSGTHTVEIRCTAPEEDGVDNTVRQTITLTLSER